MNKLIVLLWTVSRSLNVFGQSTSVGPLDSTATQKAFTDDGVVPDVLESFDPMFSMIVKYEPANEASTVDRPGKIVPRDLTLKQPEIFIQSFPVTSNSVQSADASNGQTQIKLDSFTFVIVDPDAPSRTNPTFGGVRHMLATGVKLTPAASPLANDGSTTSLGTLVFTQSPTSEYLAPSPPVGSGFHRYVFILFGGQPKNQTVVNALQGSDRTGFNLQEFMKEAGLDAPVAGTFMKVKNVADA